VKAGPTGVTPSGDGHEHRYHIKDLPEDIQAAYAASLNMPLEAFQNELKPPPKVPVKVNIGSYKGRSKEEKPLKTKDQCTETERDIARNRQKIIDAYNSSGLSVKQFIESYNNNLIASDIKERLGRCGHIGSTSVFYQNWLRRYQQCGLAGLATQYHDRGKEGATLSQEAQDRIEWLYLDSHKPSVKVVCELLETVRDTCRRSYGIPLYQRFASIPQRPLA
jgi:hypothetical protein